MVQYKLPNKATEHQLARPRWVSRYQLLYQEKKGC
jgi:hypothetical protein